MSRLKVCGRLAFVFSWKRVDKSSPELLPGLGSGTRKRRGRHFARAAPFLLAAVVTMTFLTIPRQPYLLDDSLSEKAVLNYAHAHHLQFGTDIIFSYGPLGFLVSRHFFPHAAGLRMIADVLLGFTVAAGVCLVAWRLGQFWRWLLVGLFVLLAANIDPRADLLLYIGLLCWRVLCVVETGSRLVICLGAFSAVAAFGMLVKANFLFVGGLSTAAVGADLILRGNYRAAAGLVAGLVGLFLLGWVASGQELSHIRDFLKNSMAIVQGYDQAVGFDGLAILTRRGLVVLVLVGMAMVIRILGAWEPSGTETLGEAGPHPRSPSPSDGEGGKEKAKPGAAASPPSPLSMGWRGGQEERSTAPTIKKFRRTVLLIWLCGLLLLIWKHGFVRADLYHMGFFFGFAPILALALEILPGPAAGRAKWSARGFALACCITTVATLESFYFLGASASLLQPFPAMAQNAGALFQPHRYEQEMLKQLEAVERETQLPRVRAIVGQSTVDVFGQEQFYAVFNDLNYHPRPVFQSYMAYNRTLMRLNEEFYLSPSAPEFVLFELHPIDRKFPPAEDALVLLHLLMNYQFDDSEGPFLLLRARSRNAPQLTFLREGETKLGERISLSDYGDADLWMELEPTPTWLGRVKQTLHKSSKLRLAIWTARPEARLGRYGAPAPMLRAGFLASPLLLNNDQVRGFYRSQTSIRPAAYSVEIDPGQGPYWQQQVRFRLYKIGNLRNPR